MPASAPDDAGKPCQRSAPARALELQPAGWVPSLFFVCARLRGYRFVLADAPLRAQAFRLRREVYVAAGYIGADDHGEEGFIDPYDSHSVLFLALHRGAPVGTVRLILPRPSTQVLDQYATHLPPGAIDQGYAELGRLAVRCDHRGRGRWVMLGLLGAALAWSQACGLRWWIGNASGALVRSMAAVADVIRLPELPLEPRHIAARGILSGYFERLGSAIQLFALDLQSLSLSPRRVLASMWPRRRS